MITIQQVAQRAGVSPSTVSRVLNGKASHLVSEATRKRVEIAADELGYHPSAAARTMVTGRTDVVAIVCQGVTEPHYTRMIEAARDLVSARGYHLLLASEKPGEHGATVRYILGRRQADIVLHMTYPVERVDEYADQVTRGGGRVIALGPMAAAPPLKVMSAYWDDRRGIHKGLEHLAAQGHRSVAFLAGSRGRYKQRAFEAAADNLGVAGVSITVDNDDDQLAAGAAMAVQVLATTPRPTAILARNDMFALGAIHELHNRGLRIPDDISIVGYNDIPTAAYAVPALTSVHTPVVECAAAVLSSALDALEASDSDAKTEVHSFGFDTSLVIRASTGPPARAVGGSTDA